MIIRTFRRAAGKRKKHNAARTHNVGNIELKVPTRKSPPYWEEVLTASLKANALAPAEEVILHAFDLYCEELNAPFNERRRLMSERFSNIAAGFARIQSLAPDMVERAAAKNRLELNRFINHGGDI